MDSGVSYFVSNLLTTHFLEHRKPGGDKVKILQAQPLAISATIMKKLKSYVRLALTHGNLNTYKYESRTRRNPIHKDLSVFVMIIEAANAHKLQNDPFTISSSVLSLASRNKPLPHNVFRGARSRDTNTDTLSPCAPKNLATVK